MARSDSGVIQSRMFALWCGVVTVAALYFARDILLPLAMAILLSFLLAPLVKRLEKWGARRVPAVVIVAIVSFGLIATLGYVLALQIYDLGNRLPEYKINIIAKVELLRGTEEELLKAVNKTIETVEQKVSHKVAPKDLAGEPDIPTSAAQQPHPGAPMPVEIVSDLSLERITQGLLGPIISPLGTAALVVVFVVFMLIERENLRNRVIHLIGSRQLNVATQALDDAASRVSRFLRMQLIVNSAVGCVVAVGLFLIGVPNVLVWGMLATILRFVPYVGIWIAAAIPAILAAAVFEGWTRPVLVLALFIGNELITNNVIEPWLYGSSTGISTMGILVSSVFWLWLWGPVGLVMATPLTVCLGVLGRYVPQLSFLDTLLSNEEVLSPDARFYQRLLAMDPEEATDIAEEYLKEHSLGSLYDQVLLPALSLAEQDRHQGDLDESRERFILKAMRELVDELGANARAAAVEALPNHRVDAAHISPQPQASLLCLPARDEADEIAGVMLVQLLAAKGVRVVLASAESLSGEMVAQVSEEAPNVVCVSALPPLAATHARYLCKRLRLKFPHLKIVVGLWQTSGSTKKAQARLLETGIDRFVTTLAEAAEYLSQVVRSERLLVGTGTSTIN